MNAKQAATNITGTVAKPSRPSVRLTAFDAPIITNNPNGINNKKKMVINFIKIFLFTFKIAHSRIFCILTFQKGKG